MVDVHSVARINSLTHGPLPLGCIGSPENRASQTDPFGSGYLLSLAESCSGLLLSLHLYYVCSTLEHACKVGLENIVIKSLYCNAMPWNLPLHKCL
jgi:hypothetical protein